jgi:hypothetical protein
MNKTLRILLLAVALCAGIVITEAADKPIATPKGGRALEKTEPLAELVVEKDHSVTIHFYDAKLKPVAATVQNVVVQAEAKEGKVKLEFEKKRESLVSKTKLPAGDGYNLVVQFKATPESKLQNYRFKLDLKVCGECKRLEYGCICGH